MRQRRSRRQGGEPGSVQPIDLLAWVKQVHDGNVIESRRMEEVLRALADESSARQVEALFRSASQQTWQKLLSEPLMDAPLLTAMLLRFDWFEPVHKALGAHLQREGRHRLASYLLVLTLAWCLAGYVAWWHHALTSMASWNLGVVGPLALLWAMWSLGRWGWLMQWSRLGSLHGRLSELLQREKSLLAQLRRHILTDPTLESCGEFLNEQRMLSPWFWATQLWSPQEQQNFVRHLQQHAFKVDVRGNLIEVGFGQPELAGILMGLVAMMVVNPRLFDTLHNEPTDPDVSAMASDSPTESSPRGDGSLLVMLCSLVAGMQLPPEQFEVCKRAVERYANRFEVSSGLSYADSVNGNMIVLANARGELEPIVKLPASIERWWRQVRSGNFVDDAHRVEDDTMRTPASCFQVPDSLKTPLHSTPPKLKRSGSRGGGALSPRRLAYR